MSANLGAIRTALKGKVDDVAGLPVDSIKDNPEAPCALIYPEPPFNWHEVFDDGFQIVRFIVLVLVAYNDVADAQSKLDGYLAFSGSGSVPAAIEADQTLGGVVKSATVTECRSYSVISFHDAGSRYLSAELVVEIYA